jgi:4-amino-4-deoxy-L-arabinose transferase-like glycosyltransferase
MLETGSYLIPIHGTEIYLSKPPLFNWLILLTSLPSGTVTEVSARLPSVLSLALLVLVFVATARPRLGLAGLAFLGCGLALAPEFLAKARLAEIEVSFTFLVATSVWLWFVLDQRGWGGVRLWVPPLILVALAFLAKREPAPVFFYLSVGGYLLLRGRWRELFTGGHVLALAGAAAIVGAWIGGVASESGWGYLWMTVKEQLLYRGQGGAWSAYAAHLLTYPLQILVALLPFSLFLLPLASACLRHAVGARYGEAGLFAAVAVLANLPLYWFKGDLSVRYFMPMFPFVLLLAAMVYETGVQDPDRLGERWRGFLRHLVRVLFWLLPLAALVLGASALLPWVSPGPGTLMPWPVPGLLAAGALVAAWAWYREADRYAVTRFLPYTLVLVLLVRGVQFNALLPEKAAEMERLQNAPAVVADLIRDSAVREGPIYAYWDIPSALWFYAPTGLMEDVRDGGWLFPGELLLLHASHLEGFTCLGGPPLETLASYPYEGDELLLTRALAFDPTP